MNIKIVLKTIGKVLLVEAVLLLLPTFTSIYYKEETAVYSFLLTIVIALFIGLLSIVLIKTDNREIFAKEGLITVALSWIIMSVIGALPFTVSGEIPSYIDALFETVSGFTTTGSSILDNVEELSKGMLMWRSFTHWIGGMGVLVFVIAILGKDSDKSINFMRAEMPGPSVDKIVPKAKKTAKILYIIYMVLTLVLAVMLLFGGMSLFESLVHAFGTAGTGGFGIKVDSVGSYSPYCQYVIAVFMLLFGINFNLYYVLLMGKIIDFIKDKELFIYLTTVLASTVIIAINIGRTYSSVSTAIRTSFFQVSSIITTTGFSTADFDLWPSLCKGILFVLMFMGGCAGSTAGGFKVARVGILFEKIAIDLKKVVHPHSANVVKFGGKRINEETLQGVTSYLSIYVLVLLVTFLLLCLDSKIDLLTNISATVSCLNNIGPGFNLVGASRSFSCYNVFSKIVLTFAMLFGRLEIYPMLIIFNVNTWRKK